MLLLLARRAYAKVLPRLGAGATADPWCGLSLLVERIVGDGPGRTPMGWLDKWSVPAVQAFAIAAESPLLQASRQCRQLPDVASLVGSANEGRKHLTSWGVWASNEPAVFGVGAVDDATLARSPAPASQVVGVLASPTEEGFSRDVLATLNKAKGLGLEAWAEVPAESSDWDNWGPVQWSVLHRLGVACWFQPPNQEKWPLYAAFLERIVQGWVRNPAVDQWAWPICDLLGLAMEDMILYGKPAHRDMAPWQWEGRCKNPDWCRVRKQLWSAAEMALGGEGALEEILVASILADAKLLVSFSHGKGLA